MKWKALPILRGWDDNAIHAMKEIEDLQQSFVNMVNGLNVTRSSRKINFRTLANPDKVDNSDFGLPMATVKASKHKFENTLVGFFVGKKVAFPLVKNYVTNTWNKFGFEKMMGDDEGVFYFKFATSKGLEQVLEHGPWLIRNVPLILKKWTPKMTISKDQVTRVPVWVKFHKVPVVAYSEDGLSLIATQVGTPIMLDAFTSDMFMETWGRVGYARALIEVSANK
ncbi:retrovirus-related pol polyprotein from transposon TNT 1-94 [Tanacetum coccineum]